jgi:opacity protein-like surface antigen
LNLGADGGYYSIHSIGQHLENFSQYSAGAGISYALGYDIHLTLRYDYRDQQIDLSNYKHTGSRATIGLNFSPGSLPLSLW